MAREREGEAFSSHTSRARCSFPKHSSRARDFLNKRTSGELTSVIMSFSLVPARHSCLWKVSSEGNLTEKSVVILKITDNVNIIASTRK